MESGRISRWLFTIYICLKVNRFLHSFDIFKYLSVEQVLSVYKVPSLGGFVAGSADTWFFLDGLPASLELHPLALLHFKLFLLEDIQFCWAFYSSPSSQLMTQRLIFLNKCPGHKLGLCPDQLITYINLYSVPCLPPSVQNPKRKKWSTVT